MGLLKQVFGIKTNLEAVGFPFIHQGVQNSWYILYRTGGEFIVIISISRCSARKHYVVSSSTT